jgi:hypothetical protein
MSNVRGPRRVDGNEWQPITVQKIPVNVKKCLAPKRKPAKKAIKTASTKVVKKVAMRRLPKSLV